MRTSPRRRLRWLALFVVLSLVASLTSFPNVRQSTVRAVIDPQTPSYLDVKEWWGYYEITVTGSERRSGKRSGLPWSSSYRVHRSCEGRFHLDKAAPGYLAPWNAEAQAQKAREMADSLRLAKIEND